MEQKKRGRPKDPNKIRIEDVNLSSFNEIIQDYKRHINDTIADDENVNESLIKFVNLPPYKQNIFIVYVEKKLTVKELARLLNVERIELLDIIKEIKTELIK